MNLEKARNHISQSFFGENDDTNLTCCVCELNFTSLYSKQSHYSGKLHLQTLLQSTESLIETAGNGQEVSADGNTGSAVPSSLEVVASEYRCKFL